MVPIEPARLGVPARGLYQQPHCSLQSHSCNTLLYSRHQGGLALPQALSFTMQHSRNSLACIPLGELASTVVDRVPLLLEQLQNLEAEEAFLDAKILLLQQLHRRSMSISMDATNAQPSTVAENALKKRHRVSDGTPKRDMSGTDSSTPITSLHNKQSGGIILSLEDNSDKISKRGRYDKLHV